MVNDSKSCRSCSVDQVGVVIFGSRWSGDCRGRSFPNRRKARFALIDAEVSHCNVTQHRMNHPPMKQYPRLSPLVKKEDAERIYKEMVDNRIMEE
ncbi:hypothetical protein AVEN_157826-1 [Araneus ventricosus]|uniref:Uncharacterized protein n=1 Tax=Araneus ventricosus TaxID=182803 RepID=A0A4Y2IM47_ARAVE|nr:hypothetical protein AVEN_157826-1 [Araneus ventricosus]